jgi:hypothetical protein
MNEINERASEQSATRRPWGSEHGAHKTRPSLSSRLHGWARIAALVALAAAAAWGIGREASLRIFFDDTELFSRPEPAPSVPKSRNPLINEFITTTGWVGNLDGTAVAYSSEADELVASDGRFQTDLTPQEAHHKLGLDAAAISKKGSPDEIDSDVVLFKAQAGTLTETAKALGRILRSKHVAAAIRGEWDLKDFSFTLNQLKHPSEEEKAVLAAISRSKLGILPVPGDMIRAVPANRTDFEPGMIAVSPGMLPPEEPMVSPR